MILSGKIEYHKADLSSGKEEVKFLYSSESVIIPFNTPHLFIALEDSLFVEIYENQYEATDYPEFRRIVKDKMNISDSR
jgi:quercetin dioxygenase-like cupin family protein